MGRFSARTRLLIVFFLAGGFSQIVQALMGREILVVFYGNEISLGLFYGFWLLWIAIGSWTFGRLSKRVRRPVTAFALLIAALPAAAAGGILLLRVCRRFIDVSATQFVPLGQLALWSLLVTLPVGALVGAIFPLACRALDREKEAANVYIFDALGGLAGGALFTFLFVDALTLWQTLGSMTAVLGLSLLLLPKEEGRAGNAIRRTLALVLAAAGTAVCLPPAGPALTAYSNTLRWKSILPALELVETFDTPYQNIAIARLGAQTSVVANGKIIASFPASVVPSMEAALLYSQKPGARRILLIGGATGGLIPELLKYPVKRIDCLEADEKAFKRIRAHFPEEWRKALGDKRVKIYFGDPRLHLNRFDAERYDLIAALVPDPATAQLNRFFTREFYQNVRAALTPRGVFATEVTSASNYLGRDVKSYNASVYRTLKAVFETVRVTPGDTNYFFAGAADAGVTLDPAILAKRYRNVRVTNRTFPPQAFASILPKARVEFVESSLRGQEGEVNTDLKPVTYYLNMLLWGRFSGSEWVDALEIIRRAGGRFFLLPLCVFILLRLGYALTEEDRGREARFSAGLVVAALGFTAMALEIVLLFTFQSFFGHIYKEVALLNGLFMAGLAGGAAAMARAGEGKSQRPTEGYPEEVPPPRPWGRPGLRLLACAAAAAAFAWGLPDLLAFWSAAPDGPSKSGYWALVALSGALAGAAFPPAIRLYNMGLGDVGRSSGAIDAADHLGGALGALVTGACLVPLMGVETSCRLAAAALLASCLPLAFYEFRGSLPVLLPAQRAFLSFPFKRTSWLIAGCTVVFWLMSGIVKKHADGPIVEFGDAQLIAVSGLEQSEFHEKPYPYYRGLGRKGAKDGASFSTWPHSSDVVGYSGPINLLLSLTERGEIRGLKLIESRETPSYIEGIDAWLAGFKGKDAARPLRLGAQVDALSGATITSRAVVEIVGRSSKAVGEGVLGLQVDRGGPARDWTASLRSAKFWIIAAFLAAFFPVLRSGGERARLAYLAASVAVMGLAYNTMFSLIDVANLSEGRIPGLDNGVWYLLAGFILLTSLLWGQMYCGFVCPFGAAQELVWELGRRAGLKSYAMRGLDHSMRYVKFLLMPAALILYWATSDTVWITFNPMQHFFSLNYSPIMVILIAVVAGGSALYFRFWCRYFCPAGAFLALFNKLALARALAPRRKFSLCDLGVRAEYDIDCIQCQRCVFHPAYDKKKGL